MSNKHMNGGLLPDNTEKVVILDAGAQYGKVSAFVVVRTKKEKTKQKS